MCRDPSNADTSRIRASRAPFGARSGRPYDTRRRSSSKSSGIGAVTCNGRSWERERQFAGMGGTDGSGPGRRPARVLDVAEDRGDRWLRSVHAARSDASVQFAGKGREPGRVRSSATTTRNSVSTARRRPGLATRRSPLASAYRAKWLLATTRNSAQASVPPLRGRSACAPTPWRSLRIAAPSSVRRFLATARQPDVSRSRAMYQARKQCRRVVPAQGLDDTERNAELPP